MKKLFLLFFILIGCLLLLFFIFKQSSATIDNHTFFIEVAQTPTQQEVGLAKYQMLGQNKGMYFPFNHPDYYTFWMKDMHFPIDIIFISNGKIATIFTAIKPEKNYQDFIYKPMIPSNAVLEINAGLAKKYGFKIGDTVIIDR